MISISDLRLQRPTWAEINLDFLRSNFLEIRSAVGQVGILPVVKADAYGHGAIVIARELHSLGVERFGTATALEAIELRKANIDTPVVILSGLTISQLPLLLSYDLIPAVYNFEFLNALNEFTQKHKKRVSIHINVDTGMGRLGFSPGEAARALNGEYPYIQIEGLYTHFANADTVADSYTETQLKRFLELVQRSGRNIRYIHAANSAGVLNFPRSHLNFVRPGLILYGISPCADQTIRQKPILSLKSRIIALRNVPKGETIGYGRTFRASRDSVIATVPFGYADGLRRNLSNRLNVEIHDQLCPVAGTISMDLCMVDVTDLRDRIQLQDEVVFIGSRTTAWDWARLLETIPYEITCLIGSRVPRVYMKDGQICDVYYP